MINILGSAIFIFSLLQATFLRAEELAVPSALCRCDSVAADELEGPGQINFGAYNGSCVDTCRFRKSVVIAQKGLKPVAGKTVLSNYLHKDAYWTASIPTAVVKNVQVGFEEFIPGIFHVFLIFQFPDDQPVLLKSQSPAAKVSPLRTNNLVISAEGIPPKAGKYNLFDAYFERYPIGIRALSREQVIEYSVDKLKHKVQVYDLALSHAEAGELLQLAIESISQKSFQTKYRLLTNNCATSIFDLIDTVVGPRTVKAPFYLDWFYRLERALPISGPLGTLQIFLSRNLIGDPKGRPIVD